MIWRQAATVMTACALLLAASEAALGLDGPHTPDLAAAFPTGMKWTLAMLAVVCLILAGLLANDR